MTYTETKLVEYVTNHLPGFYIYKHYNDNEERYPEVPDILDFLYTTTDRMESIILHTAGDIIRLYQNNKLVPIDILIELRKELTQKIEVVKKKMVENLQADHHEYYFYDGGFGSSILRVKPQLLPLEETTEELIKPVIKMDENGDPTILEWEPTGETITVFLFDYHNTKRRVFIADEEFVKHLHDTSNIYMYDDEGGDSINPYDKYIGPKLQFSPSLFLTCKSCGNIFRLSANHVKWYKNKEIPLPKHCYDCRFKRRCGVYD